MQGSGQVPLRYRLLRRMPTRLRLLLIYVGSPKMTVGASAIIWDSEGRVLLVRHTYRLPSWGFPSGLVQHREMPGAAITRELREELGVEAAVEVLVHAETHAPARHMTLYYQVRLLGAPSHDGVEIDAFRYADLDELEELAGAPAAPWLRALRRR